MESFFKKFFGSAGGQVYSLGVALTFFYVLWQSLPIAGLIDLIIKLVLAVIFANFWPLYWIFVLFVG